MWFFFVSGLYIHILQLYFLTLCTFSNLPEKAVGHVQQLKVLKTLSYLIIKCCIYFMTIHASLFLASVFRIHIWEIVSKAFQQTIQDILGHFPAKKYSMQCFSKLLSLKMLTVLSRTFCLIKFKVESAWNIVYIYFFYLGFLIIQY